MTIPVIIIISKLATSFTGLSKLNLGTRSNIRSTSLSVSTKMLQDLQAFNSSNVILTYFKRTKTYKFVL